MRRTVMLATCALLSSATIPARAATDLVLYARTESLYGSGVGHDLTSLRLAALAQWTRSRPAHNLSLRYVPSISFEHHGVGATRTYHEWEVALTPTPRAGLHPKFSAGGEYGGFLATDVTLHPDRTLSTRAPVATLYSYNVKAEGGLTGNVSRNQALDISLRCDRSGELHPSLGFYPPLMHGEAAVRAEKRVSRTESARTQLTVEGADYGSGNTNTLTELRFGRSRRVSSALNVSVDAGVAGARRHEANSGVAPLLVSPTGELSIAYSLPQNSGVTALELWAHAGPEFDRLDRAPHKRLQARAAVTVGRAVPASLRTVVQWASDLGGGPQEGNVLSLETLLRVPARDRSAAEFGVRAYRQEAANGPARGVFGAVQWFAGWTVAWKER